MPDVRPRLDDAARADLDGELPVDDATVEAYERDGFVRLAGVLAPETVAGFGAVVDEVARTSDQAAVPMAQRTVYQRAFVQEPNLWQRVESIRPLVFSTKLARIAARLLRADGVRLYHDQALVKEVGGGRTPWHCDQYYWPLATDRVLTAWIALHDVPAEMGPLAFATGSHRVDLGRELDISEESEARIMRHRRWRELPVSEAELRAGDVSFHAGWTFHGAAPNHTDRSRLALTMIYLADGTCLAEPVTDGQRFDRRIWLPDAEVGEPIGSWLNPLVWSSDGRHLADRAALPAPSTMLGTFDLRG